MRHGNALWQRAQPLVERNDFEVIGREHPKQEDVFISRVFNVVTGHLGSETHVVWMEIHGSGLAALFCPGKVLQGIQVFSPVAFGKEGQEGRIR